MTGENDTEALASWRRSFTLQNGDTTMATYIARKCPRCAGTFHVAIANGEGFRVERVVRGRCIDCGHLQWFVITGGNHWPAYHHFKDINPTSHRRHR